MDGQPEGRECGLTKLVKIIKDIANSPRNMASAINRRVQLSGANRDAKEGNKSSSWVPVF
jgi:hypothetical protein